MLFYLPASVVGLELEHVPPAAVSVDVPLRILVRIVHIWEIDPHAVIRRGSTRQMKSAKPREPCAYDVPYLIIPIFVDYEEKVMHNVIHEEDQCTNPSAQPTHHSG